MRLLLCHNYYKIGGGEDRCYEDEAKLLEANGHLVVRYEKTNDHINGSQQLSTAVQAIWNRQTIRDVRHLIRSHRIELVHCTNTFPVISPSIYHACRREAVPVVQSLHNYRLFCSNSYFLRDGKVCEDCVGRIFPWPAIRHACYRDSRIGSMVVAGMQAIHHRVGSWHKRVNHFIVLTEFAKQKFIDCGLPEDRISIKPNFVDPIPPAGHGEGNYALFAGRLSTEKGIDLLLDAWSDPRCSLPLRIAGDGPMQSVVEKAARSNPRIQYVGRKSPADVLVLMANAKFLVVPSIWYEGLPRTIVESLAVGTPVIAAEIGGLTELVRTGAGGIRFPVGDQERFIEAIEKLCSQPELAAQMRTEARQEFLDRYTAKENYQYLMDIYQQVTDVSHPLTETNQNTFHQRGESEPTTPPPSSPASPSSAPETYTDTDTDQPVWVPESKL